MDKKKFFRYYHQDSITALYIGKAYFWQTKHDNKICFGLFGKIIITIQIKRKDR